MKKIFLILLLAIITCANFFFTPAPRNTHNSEVEQFFHEGLDTAVNKLLLMEAAVKSNKDNAVIQQSFLQARTAYKQIEFLFEYYYPYLIRRVNGPALPFADGENSLAILPPEGLIAKTQTGSSRITDKTYSSNLCLKSPTNGRRNGFPLVGACSTFLTVV